MHNHLLFCFISALVSSNWYVFQYYLQRCVSWALRTCLAKVHAKILYRYGKCTERFFDIKVFYLDPRLIDLNIFGKLQVSIGL